MPHPISRERSVSSASFIQPSEVNVSTTKRSGVKRRTKTIFKLKVPPKEKQPLSPSKTKLEQRSLAEINKSKDQTIPKATSFLKVTGSLEAVFHKIFWAVYPQLKADVGLLLEQLKMIEDTLHHIDQLPTGAIRNKKSYSQDLKNLVQALDPLKAKLEASLEQAQAKAAAKKIPFDGKLESFIQTLKESLPTPSQLKAGDYWPE